MSLQVMGAAQFGQVNPRLANLEEHSKQVEWFLFFSRFDGCYNQSLFFLARATIITKQELLPQT